MKRLILIVIFLVVSIGIFPAYAEPGDFRSQFIDNQKNRKSKLQTKLVKENKAIMPGEVKSLVDEAMKEGTSYEKRMFLLRTAHQMALMNRFLNQGDKELLKEVEALQKKERAKGKTVEVVQKNESVKEKPVKAFQKKERAMESSDFFSQFVDNKLKNRFKLQTKLVRENKAIIPGEVKSLADEAMKEGTSYKERMFLLHIARQMAHMNRFWNKGDKKLLKEVEALQKIERKKERAREAKRTMWNKDEKMLGNFVLRKYIEPMKAKGLSPVVYPHWLHRTWFSCKICHQDIFIKTRGANDIKHSKIDEGEQCGVCHNGEMAFSA